MPPSRIASRDRPIVCLGRDPEIALYLGRRLKGWRVVHLPLLEDLDLGRQDPAFAVLQLESDFPPPFEVAARALVTARIPFLVSSTLETMRAAVRSIQLGAVDYLLADEDREAMVDTIHRCLEPPRGSEPLDLGEATDNEDAMVGHSQRMQEVFKLVGRVAGSDVSVLLQGESGTGKELVARLLHANSARRHEPFVVIDCAAIPRNLIENELFGHEAGAYSGAAGRGSGKFDLANRGTVFLDEVTELDLDLQSKILRVMQQGTFDRVGGSHPVQVDVRTIAATQANLEDMVRDGRFRQDLYHRLNVINLHLPPLRDRAEDIPLLVQHFVRKHAAGREPGRRPIAADLMARLGRYPWPGNVRELENLVRRALLLERGPVLTARFMDAFPVPGEGPLDETDAALDRLIHERFLGEELNWKRSDVYRQMLHKVERMVLGRVLARTAGNQVGAARLLGISRNTLRVKMAELGLDSADFR